MLARCLRITVPAAKLTPADTPSTGPETVTKAADRRWENASAKPYPGRAASSAS